MSSIDLITLNDGLRIPAIGFGSYLLKGQTGVDSIKNAIELGYRLIDSAFNYENEGTVGEAIRQSSVSRDRIIVTSKLPGRHHQYKEALDTIQESLFRTGLSYYDIYLIHWPNPLENKYVEAWQALIEAKSRGLVRSIGVCNFLPEHLEKLEKETGILPSINQIEMHPYFNQMAQLKWHQKHGIITEAWSPLGRGNTMLHDESIEAIADGYHKSIAQVILRWHIQHQVIPIPKAVSNKHQLENMNVFDFTLTDGEMETINSLTRKDGRTHNQDPAVYQEF